MKATILDVARVAGVSKGTVSLVVNDSGAIKPQTRARVHQAIEKLHYVPDESARELTTRRKRILGSVFLTSDDGGSCYLVGSPVETLFHETYTGISWGLARTKYGLVNQRFPLKEQGKRLPGIVESNRIAGLFLIGGLCTEGFIRQILETGLPCVIVGNSHRQLDSVDVDVGMAAYLAVKHLIDRGHRRIAFINGPDESTTSAGKRQGFRDALEDAGIECNERLLSKADCTGEAGYRALRDLWKFRRSMTALFCAHDRIAAGAMRFLYDSRVRIPDDFSIVGCEHSLIAEYPVPALTTVKIFKERMGEEACGLLLKRIENPDRKVSHVTLKPELVVRDSTGAP